MEFMFSWHGPETFIFQWFTVFSNNCWRSPIGQAGIQAVLHSGSVDIAKTNDWHLLCMVFGARHWLISFFDTLTTSRSHCEKAYFPMISNVKYGIDWCDNSEILCSQDIDSWKSDDQKRKVFLHSRKLFFDHRISRNRYLGHTKLFSTRHLW